MAKGILKKLDQAIDSVNDAIRLNTDQSSLYSRGLSREGYLGGYVNALSDVVLILRGITPCNEKRFWE